MKGEGENTQQQPRSVFFISQDSVSRFGGLYRLLEATYTCKLNLSLYWFFGGVLCGLRNECLLNIFTSNLPWDVQVKE